MATKRKPRTRKEELRSSSPVRRSPRLSARHSYQPEVYSHQLHFTASSRQSLNTRDRSSRSGTPSTILDESGQSVPPSFENFEDTLSSGQIEAAHLRVREIQERTGMPKHLYGLDYEEETTDVGKRSNPVSGVSESHGDLNEDEEVPRIWHKYDKERLYVTTTPTKAAIQPGQSSFGAFVSFCFSILFKLGSFMYLASTAVMCLDVIILHRLFNVSSTVSQIGGALRFFILLLALVTLGGFLLGGKDISQTEINQMVGRSLETSQQDIQEQLNESFQTGMDTFRQDTKQEVNKTLEKYRDTAQQDLKEKIKKALEDYTGVSQQEIDQMITKSLSNYKGISQQEIDLMVNKSLQSIQQVINDTVHKSVQDSRQKIDQMVQQALLTSQDVIDRKVNQAFQDSKPDIELIVKQFLQGSRQEINNMVAQSLQAPLEDLDQRIKDLINQSLQEYKSKSQQDIHHTINQTILEALHNMPHPSTGLSPKDIHMIINQSLKAYSADKIGSFDFILENSGGSVMLSHCSSTYSHSVAQISLFGFTLWHIPSSPKVIIQPSIYPGDCWAMEGQSGFATVKMSSKAVITAITLDHIPRELTPNGSLSSAPKEFSVIGLTDLDESGVVLGNFTYDLDGATIQQYDIVSHQDRPSQYVRFEFNSNHGNKDYTCVYRVRVHGHYP